MDERWSEISDDLQIQALVPGPAVPGGTLTLTLRMRNTGPQMRRVYMLRSEPFRAMQSTLRLDRGAAGPPEIQPHPRPHGYVVTEDDFHAIEPGQIRTFDQTLRIPGDLPPGTYPVRWTYGNRIERWEGGVQTLDGPTRPLFGGERIPGIWTGTLEYRFEVVVQPA